MRVACSKLQPVGLLWCLPVPPPGWTASLFPPYWPQESSRPATCHFHLRSTHRALNSGQMRLASVILGGYRMASPPAQEAPVLPGKLLSAAVVSGDCWFRLRIPCFSNQYSKAASFKRNILYYISDGRPRTRMSKVRCYDVWGDAPAFPKTDFILLIFVFVIFWCL